MEQFAWNPGRPSTRWKLPIQLLAVLALVLFSIRDSSAQTTTSGGLTGIVTDPSGAVVPDASVEIRDNAKGTTASAKTDREGLYQFFFLAPGRYTLTAMHDGFRTASRAVNVLLGPEVTVNVTLEIARESTTVKVTAEAPFIRAENGDVSATMNQKQISEVPNPGNDLTYIVQTAPGVLMNTEMQNGANFSILGMPGTSNVFSIDGMSENDYTANINLTGGVNLLLGQNQIQEATVVSIGYSGQFGGAAGGSVNYITKSGNNEFHGNAQFYWNGRILNANDWFNNAFGKPRAFDIADQWAGSLGGPIKKNKLFFFLDSEGTRLLILQDLLTTIPSPQFEAATIANIDSRFGAASASDAFYKKIFNLYNAAPGASSAVSGAFDGSLGCAGFSEPRTGLGINIPCAAHFITNRGRPNSDTLTSVRVDWNLGNDDRAFMRMQYDGGHNAFFIDPINPSSDAIGKHSWWQAEFIETHTFGSSAASQFLFGGYYKAPIFQVLDPRQTLAAFPTNLNFNAVGTFTNLGGNTFVAVPSGLRQTQYQFSEDLVKNWGRQKFSFGASFERIHWSILGPQSNIFGSIFPQTLDAFYQGGVDPGVPAGTDPNPDFTQLDQAFTSKFIHHLTFYNLGLYGQDEWHAGTNITLTFALRAEHRSNPVCQDRCFARLAGPFGSVSHDPAQPYNQAILINQKQAFNDIDNILWSPRFSFAWQPFGVSGNTVIRGGAAIFYDPVSGGHTFTLARNPPLVNSYTIFGDNLAPGESTNLFKDAAASNAAFLNGFSSGQTLAQIQATISSFYPPGFSPPAFTNPQGKMHAPQYQRWNLELQRAFGPDNWLSVGYFGNHGIRELAQNPNANAFGFGSFPAQECNTSPPVPPCADPRFTQITDLSTNAVSSYNALVASFRHRFSRFGQGLFQVNYTYGRTLDEVSNGGLNPFTFGSSIYPQDPNNLRGSYGPAEYDVRHSVNANYVWEIPVKAAFGGHGPDSLMKGWQVSGTVFARTGLPYTVIDFAEGLNLNTKNFFGTIFAVPTGASLPSNSCGEGAAIPLVPNPCQPPQVLANGNPNPNARFLQTGCETGFNTGNLPGPLGPCSGPLVTFAQGRNRFRAPSYLDTDFSIMKNTKLRGWEKGMLGIGLQFFNLFNHPNFSIPDNFSSDQTFGQILFLDQPPTSILGAGLGGDVSVRMIQIKVQLQF